MAGKSTQFGGNQLRKSSVGIDTVAPNSISSEELVDHAVTKDKIALRSIDVEQLSDSVLERLLPQNTINRRYSQALEASPEQPSESNPIATMRDVHGVKTYWGAPVSDLPNFSNDQSGSVKLSKQTGTLYFKGPDGIAKPVAFDHSAGTNLENNPEHRHVDSLEKSLIEALVSAGSSATEIAYAAKRSTSGNIVVQSAEYDDVPEDSNVLFIHDDINDFNRQRIVMVFGESQMAGLYSTDQAYYGHGAWFKNSSAIGTGRCDEGDRHVYVQNNRYMVGDETSIDRSVIGMTLQGTSSVVVNVDRDFNNRIYAEVSPESADKLLPFILSSIEIGKGTGWVGPKSLLEFKPKFDIARSKPNASQIVSDSEGSYYVFTLDGGGRLSCTRFHSSGEYQTAVRLIPNRTGDQWPQRNFQSMSVTCLVREEISAPSTPTTPTQLAIRKIVILLVDNEGSTWLLSSSEVPRSSGFNGSSVTSISLSLSEYMIDTSEFNGHIPRHHELVVIGQGRPEANVCALTADDGVMVWTLINDGSLELSRTGIVSTSLQASDFKATTTDTTVEILARTYEGRQAWTHFAIALSGGLFGTMLPVPRPGKHKTLPPISSHSISICQAISYQNGVDKTVVLKAWTYDGTPHFCAQILNGSSVDSEVDTIIRGVTIDDITLLGSANAYLLSRSDKDATGLSMRRIVVASSGKVYAENANTIGPYDMLCGWLTPVRVMYDYDGNAISTRYTRQSKFYYTTSGFYRNDHDIAILTWDGSSVKLQEAKPPVRLRSVVDRNPSAGFITPILSALENQFDSVQSMVVARDPTDVNDVDIIGTEGSAASSCSHISSNEWVFISGGMRATERETVAEKRLVIMRNRMVGSPAWPDFAIKVIEDVDIIPRAYHSQYVIAKASSDVLSTIEGSSAFIFTIGGRKEGGVDKNQIAAMAPPIISRFHITGLDDLSNDLSNVNMTLNQTVDFSAVLPYMIRPCVFMTFDGSFWSLVIVDAPRVWVIKEHEINSFFTNNMPDVTNAYRVGPDLQVAMFSRNTCAFFQEVYNASGEYAWNPDIYSHKPGKSTVLCLSGGSDDSGGSNLMVMNFDPNNESDISWREVTIQSNERPSHRTDASFIWSGAKYGVNGVETKQIFWLYGGNVNGTPSSEVWMMEYWRDPIGSDRAVWMRMSDSDSFNLLPPASSPIGVRRPVPTSKSISASHDAYFGLGRLVSGSISPTIYMVKPPVQMKRLPDLPLEGYSMDMGGVVLPSKCWVTSEPIDVRNVASIRGQVSVEAYSSFHDDIKNVVRIAIGADGTEQLYSINNDNWNTTPFELDDMDTEAGTLYEFQAGIAGASPLIRGDLSTPFFTTLVEKLYIVLMIPAMDPNDEIKISNIQLQTTILSVLNGGEPTWTPLHDEIDVALVSSKGIVVNNKSGALIPKLKIVVAGYNNTEP